MNLATLLARAEITDVLTNYVRGADRNDWELVRSCYHPDATDDHGLYAGDVDGLMAFLAGVATTLSATSHQLGPPQIEVHGDAARAETYCLGWYERPGSDNSVWSVAQGLRYLDCFERREGRWAIASRLVVLDWERVFSPGRTSAPAPSWQRGARGDADPSSNFFTNLPDRS
jgi:SnoaL-like domain